MVRPSYFVCPMSPFLLGCRYFDDVPSRYDVAKKKGPFHLEQHIYDFVLPGL